MESMSDAGGLSSELAAECREWREKATALSQQIHSLLEQTAEGSRPRRACGTMLWMVRHRNGKLAPYTAEAVNHFINCPKAEEFRKGR